MQASGHHKVLDYLSLSLSLPLYFHPHSALSQKFTKSVKDLLPFREEMRTALYRHADKAKDEEVAKNVLRLMINNGFSWNDRYKSDFGQEFYQAQGAITPLLTGSADAESFRQ